MTIRQERKEDLEKIYRLVKEAFETAEVSDGTEQDFQAELRKSVAYIPELSLVAETDEEIIGHIMLSGKTLKREAGDYTKVLLLAPLSVKLSERKKGVGARLVATALNIAKVLGYKAVFLCGNPAYYARFGFLQASDFGVTSKNGVPEQFVLALELETNALRNLGGGTVDLV